MKATKAYIAGVGTTGLLVASSLLVLAVMSALVAFRGFPGPDVQDPVQSILVETAHAPVTVAVPASDSASVRAVMRRSAAPWHRRASDGARRTGDSRPTASPHGPGALSQPRTTTGSTGPVPVAGAPEPVVPTPSLPNAPSLPKVTVPPPSNLLPPPTGLSQPGASPVDQSVQGVNDTAGATVGGLVGR